VQAVQAVSQVKQELGTVPAKYLPKMQLLQSLAPIPIQLAQGETQGWHVLSEDCQYYPAAHTLLHSFPLTKAKVGVLQTEH
jgi:hypothetical protein